MFKRIASVALSGAALLLVAASDGKSDSGEQRRPASIEMEVLAEINYARENPADYAEMLREYREFFDGRLLRLPGDENGIMTREGTRSVDDAIRFLERQQPLPPLDRGAILALAASDHAEAQGAAGGIGHVSADGASPGERVRRRGGDIFVGESIYYGEPDPENVVRSLIVDDGVPGRGHRALLFDKNFRFAGIGCGRHRRYGHICVVDLSGTANGGPVLPQGPRRIAPRKATR